MTVKHVTAVRRTVRAARLADDPGNLPLIELCLTLARQVDMNDPDGPSTRLSAAYLSALKDLRKACEVSDAPRSMAAVSELDRWRADHSEAS